MSRLLVALLVLAACGGAEPAPVVEPAPEPAPVEEPVPAPAPTPAPEVTPQSLYEACGDRLENPQAEGECTADDGCATAGASGEVCTTAEAATDIMTSAEVLPCFAVLDTCGCTEGQCTWTLKDAVPAAAEGEAPTGRGARKAKSGGMLPPTGQPTGQAE